MAGLGWNLGCRSAAAMAGRSLPLDLLPRGRARRYRFLPSTAAHWHRTVVLLERRSPQGAPSPTVDGADRPPPTHPAPGVRTPNLRSNLTLPCWWHGCQSGSIPYGALRLMGERDGEDPEEKP
jgi:hypothetical protein